MVLQELDYFLEKKGISRKQFCTQIEIPSSTIATWKSKNILPNTELICKVARFINVSIDWLLTGKEETDQVIDTHLYKLAKEHEGVLKGFDCLDEEKQKAISKEIADSLELRRLQREAKLKK